MKGFSLIELVMVLVITGIMAAIAIPMWGPTINLGAQADLLANDILYTQVLSISTGATNAVPNYFSLVKLNATSYHIINATSPFTAVIYPGTGSTTLVLNPGITFGTFTNLPNNLISFDARGVPYTDNAHTLPLVTAATIPLVAADGETKTLSIAPQTGVVTIQ